MDSRPEHVRVAETPYLSCGQISSALILIRPERAGDEDAIRRVNRSAFEQTAEANLVDTLREVCPDALSLVADEEGEIVGHILFTEVILEADGQRMSGLGLAPMAVLPSHQRRGIGSLLVEAGIEAARSSSYPFVVVVGHPGYYPRFGFEPASRHGLLCQWPEVPDEAFMVLIFDSRTMAGASGLVLFRSEFDQAM